MMIKTSRRREIPAIKDAMIDRFADMFSKLLTSYRRSSAGIGVIGSALTDSARKRRNR